MKNFLKKSQSLIFLVRAVRQFFWKKARLPIINEYIRNTKIKKLQIGAGSHALGGWLNTDFLPNIKDYVVFLDATKKFPFEDDTFDYIFSEHQIEHITYQKALFMLGECFRVSKIGSKIRIATPNLIFYIQLFNQDKDNVQKEYIKWVTDSYISSGFYRANEYIPPQGTYSESFVINDIFRNYEHQFIYDVHTLKSLIEQAGFIDVTVCNPSESSDQNLLNVEGCSRGLEKVVTLVLEATKR